MAPDKSAGLPGASSRVNIWTTPPRIGVQPAPHGIALHPEEVRHLAASAGLLGPEEIQRWSAVVFLGLVLGGEERFALL
jgi:hypothetical protein